MTRFQHTHRHLRRNPDFWSDLQNGFKDLNPFAPKPNDPTPTPGNGGGNNGPGFQPSDPPRDQQPPSPKTPTPNPKPESTSKANQQQGATTIVRTVFQTQAPTADGPILGFSTQLVQDGSPTSKPSPKTIQTNGPPLAASSTSLPASIVEPLTDSIPTTLAFATDSPSIPSVPSQTLVSPDPITTAPSSTATSADGLAEKQTSSGDTSGAAKAGIAIGVLAGLLVIFLLGFCAFNRHKKRLERQRLEDDDEKINGPFGAAAAIPHTPSNPNAPRISLRPVTQFLPNWNLDKRTSRVANGGLAPAVAVGAIGTAVTSTTPTRAPGQSPWERPLTSQSANPANPFGNQAERLPHSIAEEPNHEPVSPVSSLSPSEKPLPEIVRAEDPLTANGPPVAAAAGAVAGGAVAVGALARKASIRKDAPKALDLTLPLPPPLSVIPPSPAGTDYSVNSVSPGQSPGPSAGAAAIAAAGGPAGSTVHRVQLDFKPTLEDEMGLRAGQLVRLLHEYDDGWALCIRLDRSQQGVVPRTCLSTRPVKPRPQNGGPRGPPVNPIGGPRGPPYPAGQRPMTPQGGPTYPRPESPSRPMTAGARPASPAGRPMSPAGMRSQSPGPRYQGPPAQRPQSPSGMGTRKPSPPGPSRIPQPTRMNPIGPPPQHRPGPPTGPVERKPVPGQAY